MLRHTKRFREVSFAIAVVVATIGFSSLAHAELQESQVLLLYNSESPVSAAIAQAYLTTHPGVKQFDLDINYSRPLHQPQNLPPVDPGCDYPYPGDNAITEFYITPTAYQTFMRQPVAGFLALPQNADVVAIATTRGLPAAIGNMFAGVFHNGDKQPAPCSITSMEAMLAGVGFDPATEPLGNPYGGWLATPFTEFLQIPDDPHCGQGGTSVAGKMYLVSRLDSADADQDGSHVDDVIDLINRSEYITVNKRAVTLVFDDKPDCLAVGYEGIAGYMRDRDWCVYYDQTLNFLDGANVPDPNPCDSNDPCGAIDPGYEGQYIAYPELVHAGLGRNHRDGAPCLGTGGSEDVCAVYNRYYNAHPGGLTVAHESWSCISLRIPTWPYCPSAGWAHGSALDWIGAGGSFTVGNVNGGAVTLGQYIIANLYVHGLSWGEAAWTSLPIGQHVITPIGDPLARVHVFDPDVNGDDAVDLDDMVEVMAAWGACPAPPATCPADINQDGVVNIEDRLLVEEAWGRDCSGYPTIPNAIWPDQGYAPNLCGDTNGDQHVDQIDLDLIEQNLGSLNCPNYDVNRDGVIDQIDVDICEANQGRFLPDFSGDGCVNIDDIIIWAASEDLCEGDPGFNPSADGNCDGCVDGQDYVIMQMNWGSGCR